jgi:hypothetical protein
MLIFAFFMSSVAISRGFADVAWRHQVPIRSMPERA